ncbi:bifunctional heptose 7-phosphate kinase/heptose 1-phosphate adenyltransferase [Halothermothrix orenii]|uniref:Rfae domain I n=1 Tax=Halothermothrix orenii (strain H 168 / OCM 544 / DSM 9562) TaxID=373903 RepID=B8CYN1_HALOH|nr:PfkB family carbohydrate kinase [Halothermothrix orenii]ACL70400.1 Rfae domain I [Halothermothrix orenii H 168]
MKQLTGYIQQFNNIKIMVVGELIADEFITGEPERISREAPVLILRHHNQQILPGGGANAAHNISSLGGRVNLVGIIGPDQPGNKLCRYLEEHGVDVNGVVVAEDRPTCVKTRILAGGGGIVKQQVVRIDRLDNSPIDRDLEERIILNVRDNIKNVDGILISDYGNGLFTERVKREIIKAGRSRGKFIAVDTRYNLLDYQGITIATPNLEEASYAVGWEIKTRDEVIKAGKEIIGHMDMEYLLITQGGDGMTLFNKEGEFQHIPAVNYTEVYDVTGAGDTVVATLSLALGAGATMEEAMDLANTAAGIVVRKSGVATVKPGELMEEVIKNEK